MSEYSPKADLTDIRQQCHTLADEEHEWAVACTDGDFLFAESWNEMKGVIDGMVSARQTLSGIDHDYVIINLDQSDEPTETEQTDASNTTSK